MKEHRLRRFPHAWGKSLVALACCALFGAGCVAAPQGRAVLPESPTPSPAVSEINSALASAAMESSVASDDYRLGAEDLLEITIFNIPEGFNTSQGGAGPLPRKIDVRVSQAGMITLPLLGDISAARLTTAGLEQSLRKDDEFLHDPQVGVYIKEYRGQQVSVIGAVGKPGMYQLTGPRTMVDLLSLAGGITEKAGSQYTSIAIVLMDGRAM